VSSNHDDIPNTRATALPLHPPTIPHPYSKETTDSAGDTSREQSQSEILSHHYPGFVTFLAPAYAKTNPDSWHQEAFNLAAMPGDTAHPTLLFYTSGPTSSHIASILRSHPPHSLSLHGALWNFFKPYVSLLPNYSALDFNCRPSAILATGWENDEFAGWGSYSNFPTGLERGDEDIRVLREGMPERGVWFAGEHCAPFIALGTVTGAYWSGEGVGRRIVEVYGLDSEGLH
jgi:hypothetical protein